MLSWEFSIRAAHHREVTIIHSGWVNSQGDAGLKGGLHGDLAGRTATCQVGCIVQGLPLRRPKEWRHYNDTVQDLSTIACCRRDLLGIVQDASLHQVSP